MLLTFLSMIMSKLFTIYAHYMYNKYNILINKPNNIIISSTNNIDF